LQPESKLNLVGWNSDIDATALMPKLHAEIAAFNG